MYKDIFDAVSNNNLTAVKQFVEVHGENPSRRNNEGDTLAHIAVQNDNLDILQYLLKEDPSLLRVHGQADSTLLEIAIAVNSLKLVRYLIDDCNVDILKLHCDQPPPDTYVHFAAEMGNLDVFKYFIEEKKVNVDLKNAWQQPPAFAAAREAHLNIIKYIVEERKGNVITIDSLKRNILCQSAIKSDLTIPRYLLDEKKLRINANDVFIIYDAIASAEQSKRSELENFIKYFVEEKRMNINTPSNSDAVPLHRAANAGMINVVKYLVNHGAEINRKDFMGRTPLQVATDKEVIEYLEGIGGRRNRRSLSSSDTPWMLEPHSSVNERTTKLLIHGPTSPSELIAYPRLDSFFILANAYIGSRFQTQTKNLVQFSRRAMIENRMDPVAIDAVRDFV